MKERKKKLREEGEVEGCGGRSGGRERRERELEREREKKKKESGEGKI